MTRGLVLGKFLPPHAGHVYLIETARRQCDDLSIVVGTLAREPIAGALRALWMRALFPDLRVLHLTDDNPQEPSEHPRFWEIWREGGEDRHLKIVGSRILFNAVTVALWPYAIWRIQKAAPPELRIRSWLAGSVVASGALVGTMLLFYPK